MNIILTNIKFDIKRSSYLQMNEKLKKIENLSTEDRKRQNKIILYQNILRHVEHGGTPVFLWFFGNLCNSAPLKFLWKSAYVSRTG